MWQPPKCSWRSVCNQPLKTTGSSSSCSSSKSAKEDGKQSREVALMARKWAESALKSCSSKGLLRSYIATVHCFLSQIWTGYSKMLLHVCALWQYTAYIILWLCCIYLCTCIHIGLSKCLIKFSHLKICILSHPIMVVAFSDPRSAWAEFVQETGFAWKTHSILLTHSPRLIVLSLDDLICPLIGNILPLYSILKSCTATPSVTGLRSQRARSTAAASFLSVDRPIPSGKDCLGLWQKRLEAASPQSTFCSLIFLCGLVLSCYFGQGLVLASALGKAQCLHVVLTKIYRKI